MKNGEISDLVKTPFGFHIIKMVDNQAEVVRPLAEVRAEMLDQLRWQKAQQDAESAGQGARRRASRPRPISSAWPASASSQFRESGLFLPDRPDRRPGPAARAGRDACSRMKEGDVSTPQRVARGWVIAHRLGPPGSLRPRARRGEGPRARGRRPREGRASWPSSAPAAIAAELKSAKDFAATVKKLGLEVKPTELIARGAAIPDLGVSDEVDEAAFALPVNGVSDPITTPQRHRHRPRRGARRT